MFSAAEILFLQRLIEQQPALRKAGVVASGLCEGHGIGKAVGGQVLYRKEHFELAQRMLVLHGFPVKPVADNASRADMAALGGLSEKSFSVSPHANSVALQLLGGCRVQGQLAATPAGMYLVATLEAARDVECDRIMVVENFETFRQLHTYQWLDYQGQRVLVVFRGDNVYSTATAADLVRQRREPVWAFTDFDPAGLVLAGTVAAGRLERLMLPSDNWLRQAADTHAGRALYAQQSQYQPKEDMPAPVLRAFRLLQQLECAVVQERMRGADA